MDSSSPSGVTELLGELREGNEEASGALFEHVYAKLRQLARGQPMR